MGIRNMLQTLHQKANILWKFIFTGNINTCDGASTHVMKTEVEHKSSSGRESEKETPESYRTRYPTLRYYAQEQLRVGRKIATGGQAVIHEAQLVSTFSIKRLPVIVKKFNRDYGVVQGLFPLEFVTYKNMYVCKPTGFFVDHNDRSLCMVMDRYAGDLRSRIDTKMKLQRNVGPPFTEPVAVYIIMQLALGLRGLHGRKIYHKDLKGGNILVQTKPEEIFFPSGILDMNFAIAISDFETSTDVQGTGFWRAPEILKILADRRSSITPGPKPGIHWDKAGIQWDKADVYSFGMTCYEILTGHNPFHEHRMYEYDVVLAGKRPELPAHVPQGLRDIIRRCWVHEPKARPTFAEIVSLLKDEYELLWAVVFSKIESVMSWELSLQRPEAILLELVRLVVTDTIKFEKPARDRKIASKFVCTAGKFVRTVEKFVSNFEWRSFAKHPSMPFAEFVDREGLYTLMSSHYTEGCDLYAEFIHRKGAAFERKVRIVCLMETVFFWATDGSCQSVYSGQDDDGLMLSDKLSIILKAFVKPLSDAGAKKLIIFKVAKRLLQGELSREYHQEYQQKEIERFQIRFLFSISPLLVPKRVVRLQDIVGFPVVEFLVIRIFSYLSMRILLRRVFTNHDSSLGSFQFLKAFLDQLAIELYLPVLTVFLLFDSMGWRSLLSWWLVDGIFKSLYLHTANSYSKSSRLVSHRIYYLAVIIVVSWRCTAYMFWP